MWPYKTWMPPSSVSKDRHKRESKNTKQKTRNKTVKHSRDLSSASLRNKKKHCLIRESCLSGTCAKQPINNISEVTWLCTWFPK